MKKLILLMLLLLWISPLFAFDNEQAMLDYLTIEKKFVCGTPEKELDTVTWNNDEYWCVNVLDANGLVGVYKNIHYYKNITTGKCLFVQQEPIQEYNNE